MFISKEMIKDIGHESVEEFILDQARSHKIRINKFTDEGVDFDYELDSGGTDDGKLHLSKIEVAREIFEEIEKHMIDLVDITNTAYKEIETATFAALKKKYTEGGT